MQSIYLNVKSVNSDLSHVGNETEMFPGYMETKLCNSHQNYLDALITLPGKGNMYV